MTSAAYTNEGSLGGVTGVSSVVSPAEVIKHGYVGQLYAVTNVVQLGATPTTVNEGSTRQVNAFQILDDASKLTINPTSVTWSVLSGPLNSISSGGVTAAGAVYQDTAASVQGVVAGNTLTLGLTVFNSNADNYGSYAGDGLPDDWQNLYFGLGNPNAAPGLDADGDGQTNLFEFSAGLSPTDHASRFTLGAQAVVGQANQRSLVFGPLVAGRTYTVKYKTDLAAASWTTLSGATTNDVGAQRTVTDPAASGSRKFYQIEVTTP